MDKYVPLHEEIFIKAAASEDSSAVICRDECISFTELDRFSSNLAWALEQAGAGPGSVVGIYLHPSISLAISVLAILKTGAAYVPLSTAFPEDRIRYIFRDAGVYLILTDDSFPRLAADPATRIFVPDWPEIRDQSEKKTLSHKVTEGSDLAYILYTSGSTGNPKGVMIEHRNLSYYVHWFCEHVMPETGVGLPLTSSFIFAAAVTQFYSTLLSGQPLHILNPMLIRQPGKLLEWYATHPDMGLYCVPTLWSEILNFLEHENAAGNVLKMPSCIYLSGEAVTDDLMKRTFDLQPGQQLWNLYGPTEATANLTAGRLFPGETAHIGRPLEGTKVFITNDDLTLVKPGEPGELLASGEGIARGYVNLGELTGTTFINMKWDGQDPIRLYRSGDLVREDESGKLIYLGRKDQQVKIRGFRIELPEIEHALVAIPQIKQAVVTVAVDAGNGKRLVSYLVFRGENSLPVDELRKILKRTLPDFMIPEVFVYLEQFPQLPNGKIDRKALPLPGVQRPDLGYSAVYPATAAEKQMVRIWEEILGLESLGLDDNFFDLGGNSLKANALVMELRTRMGISAQIKSIFDFPTPGKLLQHFPINSERVTGEPAAKTKTTVSNEPEPDDHLQHGLSENQKALWFMQQAEPDLSAYNIFYSITLKGNLDIASLEKALRTITRRHESLNTAFHFRSGKPEGLIKAPDSPIAEIFPIQPGNLFVTLSEALDHARNQASLPFNLETGPLFRFILYKTGENQHLLAFIIHHIVFDGFSFDIFFRELSFFYENEINSRGSDHSAGLTAYSQFYREERLYLNGSDYLGDKDYWQKQLSGAPAFFEIPTDFTRPETPSREGGQVRRKISPELRKNLRNLSDSRGASLFMTCLAAFSILLYRHSGRTDFLIGTPVANRSNKSFLSPVGYFVNTMLFRVGINPDLSFVDWLMRVKELVLENLSHSRFPFSHMNEVLKTERIPGSNPYFQVMFAFHETGWDFSTLSGISGRACEEFFGRSKFDLFTEIFHGPEETEIVMTYSSSLYYAGTIRVLLDHFIQILEQVCIDPETILPALNMMSGTEYNRAVYEWNQTDISPGFSVTITDLIGLQIEKTPELPALLFRHEVITYAEMDRRVATITANLCRLGVERQTPVGIHLENSPEMVMCILAVFRAGGIYIPLDPYYPEERLRYVIEKTKIRFLIVNEENGEKRKKLSENIIILTDLLTESSEPPKFIPGKPNSPGDLAYIIFTSGSTGNPKGVMIRHDSLLNVLVWVKKELNISCGDTFLSAASINFDISLFELFTPLISGGRLVLEKRSELQAPEKVEEIINEMQVNILQFVPSGLKALNDAGVFRRAKYLKTIISTGEKLTKGLQDLIFGEFRGSLINLYGPTEATVYMACWHCRRNSPLRMVPIGNPIFNANIYILDEDRNPVPVGIPGEVYIGGRVLAEGYFEDPEQTASRFFPDPFSKETGSRIYKTGDLGRFLYDGVVEFLGRSDKQIKVRGFRIEPGEIETTILQFPGVRYVVVDAREQKEEDVRLTAYIVPDPKMKIHENELRSFLKLHLPAYMIPGSFLIAPEIPVLPNGKIDFRELIKIRPQVPPVPDFFTKQMNETEVLLSDIWKEILGHECFTMDDNFFEVGGHSLLLVRIRDLISEKLNMEVSIVNLFRYPSIRNLAAFLRQEMPDSSLSDINRRVSMRNRNIRQQIMKRIIPDNNHS